MGRVTGRSKLGLGWSLQAWLQEELGAGSNLLPRLAGAQLLGGFGFFQG